MEEALLIGRLEDRGAEGAWVEGQQGLGVASDDFDAQVLGCGADDIQGVGEEPLVDEAAGASRRGMTEHQRLCGGSGFVQEAGVGQGQPR